MKSCFGTIYPDLEKFQFNKELAGKVFSLRINTVGPFHRERRLEINTTEWEECQGCELFRSCFDLSNAKLAMQRAMAAI